MRRKVITSLKTMLSFAQGQGLVAQNVAHAVRVKGDARSKPAKLKAGVDFPTKAEIRALLDNVSERATEEFQQYAQVARRPPRGRAEQAGQAAR
jgi:hypothetical protein